MTHCLHSAKTGLAINQQQTASIRHASSCRTLKPLLHGARHPSRENATSTVAVRTQRSDRSRQQASHAPRLVCRLKEAKATTHALPVRYDISKLPTEKAPMLLSRASRMAGSLHAFLPKKHGTPSHAQLLHPPHVRYFRL